MSRHRFEFAPTPQGAGWSIYDGEPRIWWSAKLKSDRAVWTSSGTDARKAENINISLHIGTATPLGQTQYTGVDPPVAKWGGIHYRDEHETLLVSIFVSLENFNRVLQAVQSGHPPQLTAGFGPRAAFEPLTGPITVDEKSRDYRWATAADHQTILVESCEFSFARTASEPATPDIPEEEPRVARGAGLAMGIAINVLAVLIAIAVLNAATTRFQAAVVSLLLAIYVVVVNAQRILGVAMQQSEYAGLSRFMQLRGALGSPASPEEVKYLRYVKEKVTKLGPRFWIDAGGQIIIGGLALAKLATLLA